MTHAAAAPSDRAARSSASTTDGGGSLSRGLTIGAGALTQPTKSPVKIRTLIVDFLKLFTSNLFLSSLFRNDRIATRRTSPHESPDDRGEYGGNYSPCHVVHPQRLASLHHANHNPANTPDSAVCTLAAISGSVVSIRCSSSLIHPDDMRKPDSQKSSIREMKASIEKPRRRKEPGLDNHMGAGVSNEGLEELPAVPADD